MYICNWSLKVAGPWRTRLDLATCGKRMPRTLLESSAMASLPVKLRVTLRFEYYDRRKLEKAKIGIDSGGNTSPRLLFCRAPHASRSISGTIVSITITSLCAIRPPVNSGKPRVLLQIRVECESIINVWLKDSQVLRRLLICAIQLA